MDECGNLDTLLADATHLRSLTCAKQHILMMEDDSTDDSNSSTSTLAVMPSLSKLTHLGVPYTRRFSKPWTRDNLKAILEGGIFPELKAIRLLYDGCDVAFDLDWKGVVEKCRMHGVRFENRDGPGNLVC